MRNAKPGRKTTTAELNAYLQRVRELALANLSARVDVEARLGAIKRSVAAAAAVAPAGATVGGPGGLLWA